MIIVIKYTIYHYTNYNHTNRNFLDLEQRWPQLTTEWVRVPVLSKATTSTQAPFVMASLKFRVMCSLRRRHLPTVPLRTIMRGSPGGAAYSSMSRRVFTWNWGVRRSRGATMQ